MTKNLRFFIIVPLILILTSCDALKYKKVDTREVPIKGADRARKNVDEGGGVSLKNVLNKRGGTNFEFSSSNPMWRASLEILDFLPLSTVDYSGGVIISDWYTDNSNKNQALKITVRFLSNVVQTNSVKVTVHRKKCSVNQTCNVDVFKSRIQEELIASILKEASIIIVFKLNPVQN